MILVALSFIYITFLIIPQGVALVKLTGINIRNFTVMALLGLFGTTLLTTLWAVFYRVNIEFHIMYLFLSCLFTFIYKKEVLNTYKGLASTIAAFPTWLKWAAGLSFLLIVAQASSSPYTVDNESYYIQTIKWLNEYGLVKGLGNLHLFFGQTSGWHITQSALNFSFAYQNFNDLSAYCLLLGNVFCFQKLDVYLKTGNFNNLVIGILPLANVLLFQFISSPSPDVPVYIMSFVMFGVYLDQNDATDVSNFKLTCLLILFVLFIKTTAVALLFLPLFMLAGNFKRLAATIPKLAPWGVVVLVLFCIKNCIVTGYFLFPVTAISYPGNWQMPPALAQLFYERTKAYGFLLTQEQYNNMGYAALFKQWLTLPKLHGLFSKAIVAMLIVTPLLIYKFRNRKKWWVLYSLMCIHMVLLFFSSPQYRFFLHFFLLFALFAAALFLNKKAIKLLLPASIALITALLVLPVGLDRLTDNKMMQANSTFSIKHILIPYPNSRFGKEFVKVREGNLEYNSPVGHNFFWSTGNGSLPCVNQEQIEYFKKHYHIVPQLLGAKLSEGFYAKETNE